jgi:tetratricopeptide (TPR) repeat protein
MLTVEARPASGGWPPTREALAAEISRRGFEHSLDVYNEARKKDSSFLLSEIAVNSWGYDLLGRAMTKEAIEIFKMNVTLYPDAFNTYDSLGEAYERAGDKENAIKNYRRSVELNPKNDNAVVRLQKLDPDGPGNRK